MMNIKKTVETYAKGIKATKSDALVCQAETSGADTTLHYKAAQAYLTQAYKNAYEGFTTDVKKQADTAIEKIVYDCFGATRKQIEALFPDRNKSKKIDMFDLDKFIAKVAETLKEKGCIKEGSLLLAGIANAE
jgi:hypothetical protein